MGWRPSKGLCAAALVAVAVVGGSALAFPRVASWAVRTRVIPKLEKRLGMSVTVGAIDAGWGTVQLSDLRVGPDAAAPLLTMGTVDVVFEPTAALRGDMHVESVDVSGLTVTLLRDAAGRANWGPLLEARARSNRGTKRTRPPINVHGGTFSVRDLARGMEAHVVLHEGRLTESIATFELSDLEVDSGRGPKASAKRIILSADPESPMTTVRGKIEGGNAAVWQALSLSDVHGEIAPHGLTGRIVLDLAGSYGGATGELWQAKGWVDLQERAGELSLRADRFTLDRLQPIWNDTPIRHPEKASVETNMTVSLANRVLKFEGAVDLEGLTLAHPWMAFHPVEDLGFSGQVSGHYDGVRRAWVLEHLTLAHGGVSAEVEAELELPGGVGDDGLVRAKRRLAFHVVVPKVACQTVLDAFPAALLPELRGYKVKGAFDADVTVDVDWQNLQALVFGGNVALQKCKLVKAPKANDPARLLEEFVHEVEVTPGESIRFSIGPSNPDFVALTDVSPHLINSFMTTEDSRFMEHKGFISREFRTALVRNLEEGYFKFGASSITMQLVKNVLLHNKKTLSRKLQELVLTHFVEEAIGKERILEIYVNAIEFGPGIYGIGRAARHYFGKHPRDLTPVESAFFSSILPSPKRRYVQYCKNELSRFTIRKIERVLGLMRKRDRLTDEELAAALVTPLVFDRIEALPEKRCLLNVKETLEKVEPTLPDLESEGPTDPDDHG